MIVKIYLLFGLSVCAGVAYANWAGWSIFSSGAGTLFYGRSRGSTFYHK